MQNATAFVFPTAASIAATTQATKPARAPRKNAAKKSEQATVNTAKLETVARDFAKEFNAVLVARNAEVKSNDTETAARNVIRDAAAFNACFARPEFRDVFDTMLKHCAIADSKTNKTDFVAVKTLVKIVSTARAIGQGIKRELDGYTMTIGENLAALGQMRIKDGLVSLSKSVEYDELEQQAHLVRRMNCSVGTAGAQSGSTRMCLRELGIAQVVKGKRNDEMHLLPDNARANAFIKLFA
ncbi:hypothetical protein PQQ87_08465 [Paraburkholderia nemoris]|uniref:hypothetical protein n=1 Tax=Paraburkholderia nemoris TaxID=2793076 RepID=UPI0038BC51EE